MENGYGHAAWTMVHGPWSMDHGQWSNYYLCTVPPSEVANYASARDDTLWQITRELFRSTETTQPDEGSSRRIAMLPTRMGGLGLRSGTRLSVAAYWASWADCLPMIVARNPGIATKILSSLERSNANDGCLAEVALARHTLTSEGFDACPSWRELASGARPPLPLPSTVDHGERHRGWQYHASSSRELFARTMLLADSSRALRALL